MRRQKSVTFEKKKTTIKKQWYISILMIKAITKLETIVIILVNREVLHIAYVIL